MSGLSECGRGMQDAGDSPFFAFLRWLWIEVDVVVVLRTEDRGLSSAVEGALGGGQTWVFIPAGPWVDEELPQSTEGIMAVANTAGQDGHPRNGEHVPNTRRRYEPSRIAIGTSAEISHTKGPTATATRAG